MSKLALIFLTIFTLLPTQLNTAYAFSSGSSNYDIKGANFNFVSGSKSSSSFEFHDTGGEFAIGESSSSNYTAKIGFEYLLDTIPLTFTISNNSIDFGSLTPETFHTDSTDLTVTSGAANGYEVTAIANHPLELNAYSGVFIPDTLGDNNDISHIQTGDWNNTSTYGFGYTMQNLTNTDAVFTDGDGYRHFADASNPENPVVIMENSGVTEESQVRVIYRINISPSQTSGSYQNTVTYILTAKY